MLKRQTMFLHFLTDGCIKMKYNGVPVQKTAHMYFRGSRFFFFLFLRDMPKQLISNYWLCQVAGWMSMVLIETLNYTFFIVKKFDAVVVYYFLAYAILGMLLTNAYKKLVKRRGIFQASLSYIWLYAFLSTLAIATIMTLLLEVWGWMTNDQPTRPIRLVDIAGPIINWMRYVGVWIIIYFLYKILQQKNNLQKEKLMVESLAKTTELELLKQQLNPHFLFNALNSIKALVMINPQQSKDAIVKLSELLRFTLQYGKERLISLNTELQEVAKYLELEQLRFGNRLQVAYHIDTDVNNLLLPPALVLTLAENAIKHGIAKHEGIGHVVITATTNNTHNWKITVTNTGTYHPQHSQGIGLKHIRKRLEEVYGPTAAFHIDSTNDTVTATVEIPISWQ